MVADLTRIAGGVPPDDVGLYSRSIGIWDSDAPRLSRQITIGLGCVAEAFMTPILALIIVLIVLVLIKQYSESQVSICSGGCSGNIGKTRTGQLSSRY
jgi:hypothetical protein